MKKLTGSRLICLFVAVIIISVLSIVTALSLSDNIESLLIEEKGEKAMSVSIAVAKLVEQDYPNFLRLLKVEEYNIENYDVIYHAKMQRLFREIRSKTGVKFLYCCKRISEDKIIYIFDGESPRSELYSPLGSEDDLDEMEQNIYSSKVSGYTPIIDDPEWGSLLTGMTPLIDPLTGDAVAHIGVDVSVASIRTSLADINKIIMINAVIITIITSLIIYRLLCMTSIFTETDYLTGLHSKGYQDRFLKQQIKKSISTGRPFPLVMIDFDDFKMINDEHGHHFGDTVLKSVSEIIKICTRSVDCCARYGGDEFVIILPDANLEYASFVCQWLLKEVSNLNLKPEDDTLVPVSISIGIAIWEAGMAPEQILDRADKALYHSKRTGKSKVTVYSEELI
ncbi:MAG: diguanylate cyclase [Eubacteriales bacterium]|nr:diguanylate cyclase [Eubacteriales bacterium]